MRSPEIVPELLVSVRSAAEAEAALAGGVSLIDVKEPARGPLGRADDETIAAVVRRVAGRRPVSAALGEVGEQPTPPSVAGLSFIKWGLARAESWQATLTARLDDGFGPGSSPQMVITAYADWHTARSPAIDDICAFACRRPGNVLLIDTFEKGRGLTLLDCLPVPRAIAICQACRANGVRVALAGSLGAREIGELRDARPDWFAVRGAACADGRRDQAVSADKVRDLVEIIRSSTCRSR